MDHVLYRCLRRSFRRREWNPRHCQFEDIETRYNENGKTLSHHGITLAVFDTLYRRAACKIMTEGWKNTRWEEKEAARRDIPVEEVRAERYAPREETKEEAAGLLVFSFFLFNLLVSNYWFFFF